MLSCECCYTVYNYTDNSELEWNFNTDLSYKELKTLVDIYLGRIDFYETDLTPKILDNILLNPYPSSLLEWILEFVQLSQKSFNVIFLNQGEYSEYVSITDLDSGECESFELFAN